MKTIKNILSGWKPFFLALVLMACCTPRAAAGVGDGHLGLQAGVLYPRIFNVTLSYDKETRYHNAWEYYLDYSTQWNDCKTCGKVCKESFWKSRYAFGGGIAYKPAVNRGKNHVGRARIGLDLGSAGDQPVLRIGGGRRMLPLYPGWKNGLCFHREAQ